MVFWLVLWLFGSHLSRWQAARAFLFSHDFEHNERDEMDNESFIEHVDFFFLSTSGAGEGQSPRFGPSVPGVSQAYDLSH